MNSENSEPPRPVGSHPALGAGYRGSASARTTMSAIDELLAEVVMQHAITDQPAEMLPTRLCVSRWPVVDSRMFGHYHKLLTATQTGDPEAIAGPLVELLYDLLSLAVECGLPMAALWAACSTARSQLVPPADFGERVARPPKKGPRYQAPQYPLLVRTYGEPSAFYNEAACKLIEADKSPVEAKVTTVLHCPKCRVRNGYESPVCVNCGEVF